MRLNGVTETSLDAYSALKASKVRHDYGIILKAISDLRDANNMMVSVQTGLPINVVCPRMLELRKKGHLEFAGRKTCPHTGNSSQFWRVKA